MHADQKLFSWLNTLLIIATILTLVLVMAAAYKGWKRMKASLIPKRALPESLRT
jgi:hypothetical protein